MISTAENQVIHLGDGENVNWPVTFDILHKEDLHLIRVAADGTEQEITSDFYLHMDTNIVDYPGYAPGAEIPESARPLKVQKGEKLVLYRDIAITQQSDMPEQWPFDVIENAFDKACMIDQQLQGQIDRTLKINRSAWTSNFDGTIPIAPGKSLRFSEDGKKFEATEDPTVATVAAEAAANAAAASAASAATSAANVSSFYPRIEAINENVTRIGESTSYNAEQTVINKNLVEQYKNEAGVAASAALLSEQRAKASELNAKESAEHLADTKEKLDELVNVANDGTWQYDENLNIEPITRPFNNKYWKLNADGTLSPIDIAAELTENLNEKIEGRVSWGAVVDNALDVPPQLQRTTVPNAFAVNQKLAGKQEKLTAGENITITDNTISAQGKNYDSDIAEINNTVSQQFADIANLQAENEKLKRSNEALWKLNRGISYGFETDTTEAYSKSMPSGAKCFDLKSIGGKSVVVNQMLDSNNLTLWANTYSVNGNRVVATTTRENQAQALTYFAYQGFVKDHKYYVSAKNVSFTYNGVGSFNKYNFTIFDDWVGIGSINIQAQKNNISGIVQATNTSATTKPRYQLSCLFTSNTAIDDTLQAEDNMIVDLTQMFGSGNEPTIEEFEAMFPNYIPYTEPTIISQSVVNVKVQGKNLLDGVSVKDISNWEFYDYNNTRGRYKLDLEVGQRYITSVNGDKLLNKGYYLYITRYPKGAVTSIASETVCIVIQSTIYRNIPFVVDAGYDYYIFAYASTGAKSVVGDIENLQIEKSEIVTPYSPYTEQNIPIPTVDLKSAGTVHDTVEYYEENGKYYAKKIQRVGSVDSGSLDWKYNITYWENPLYYAKVEIVKFANLISNNYTYKYSGINQIKNKEFTVSTNGYIYVHDDSVNNIADFKAKNTIIYYELATPIETITEIDNRFSAISCEANGTITFENSTDYKLPVPNTEEYLIALNEVQ